jgi:hypothetical protein
MNEVCIGSFCFPSYMKGVEWASWAQAFGSVLAVLAAFLVFALQARTNRKIASKTRADRIESLWAAVACEVQASAEQAQSFLEEKIGAPAYRIELPLYSTAFPSLLIEVRLEPSEVSALYTYFANVQAMNRGIQYAHDARDRPDNGEAFQKEARRTMNKADLLRPGGYVYRGAMGVIAAHYPPAKEWMRPANPILQEPAKLVD